MNDYLYKYFLNLIIDILSILRTPSARILCLKTLAEFHYDYPMTSFAFRKRETLYGVVIRFPFYHKS